LAQTELLLCVLAGNIMNRLESDPSTTSSTVFGDWTDDFRDQFISAWLIVLVVILFGYFLFQDLQYFMKLYKDYRATKEREKDVGSPTSEREREASRDARSASQESMLRSPSSADRTSPRYTKGVEMGQFKQNRSDFLPLTHTLTERVSGLHMVGNPLWNMNAPLHDPEARDQIREVHTNPLNEAIKLDEKDLAAYTSDEVLSLAEYAGDGEYVLNKPGEAPVYVRDDGDKLILYHRTVKRKARRDSDAGEEENKNNDEDAEYEEEVLTIKSKNNADTPKGAKPMLRYDFSTGQTVRDSPFSETTATPKTPEKEQRQL